MEAMYLRVEHRLMLSWQVKIDSRPAFVNLSQGLHIIKEVMEAAYSRDPPRLLVCK